MRLMTIGCMLALVACASAPQLDNPAASPSSEARGEARALELAEDQCAKQGKHAEAQRDQGETFYTCVN